MVRTYFLRKAQVSSLALDRPNCMWYSKLPTSTVPDAYVVNVFLNIFRRHIPPTFSLFRDMNLSDSPTSSYYMAMAAVGGLFCSVRGSYDVARALYNDSRRILLTKVNCTKEEQNPDLMADHAETLQEAKTAVRRYTRQSQCTDSGGQLQNMRFGVLVCAQLVPRHSNAKITLVDGTVIAGDAIIGADGIHDLLREYEGFDERALALLRMADPSTLKVSRLMDMDTVEDWCRDSFFSLAMPLILSSRTKGREQRKQWKTPHHWASSSRPAGADIRGLESAGKKVDRMTELIQINCGYDEHHNSIHMLRIWENSNNPPKLWRMPVSFGPASGPRQSLLGSARRWSNKGSSFVSRTQNLLPNSSFSFQSPDSVAFASYVHTSLQNLDWLGGKGYDYVAFLLHGIVYRKKDGSTVTGSFVAVMWENLTDPILTGREELGCPKLFCDIGVQQNASSYLMEASWAGGAPFLKLQMEGMRDKQVSEARDDGALFFYKYIPATGRPGVADVAHPVCVPNLICRTINRVQTARTANVIFDPLDEERLPTLNHIVGRLAEIPLFELAEASVAEGVDVQDLSTAYRIE
ncbi:hypothetical protein MY5147_005943 [Beauveria neobassiana]